MDYYLELITHIHKDTLLHLFNHATPNIGSLWVIVKNPGVWVLV